MNTQSQLLQKLKKNAPKVYSSYVARKKPELEKQIQRLREEYKEEVDIKKRNLISVEALRLKEYLNLLKVEG